MHDGQLHLAHDRNRIRDQQVIVPMDAAADRILDRQDAEPGCRVVHRGKHLFERLAGKQLCVRRHAARRGLAEGPRFSLIGDSHVFLLRPKQKGPSPGCRMMAPLFSARCLHHPRAGSLAMTMGLLTTTNRTPTPFGHVDAVGPVRPKAAEEVNLSITLTAIRARAEPRSQIDNLYTIISTRHTPGACAHGRRTARRVIGSSRAPGGWSMRSNLSGAWRARPSSSS